MRHLEEEGRPPVELAADSDGLPQAADVARALSTATERMGHRPAITVLRPERRDEQGFVSLSRWAAKGAHLLEIDCFLEPGDVLAVAGPASWPLTAACYAAWWAGVTIVSEAAQVAVVDERAPPLSAAELFAVGTGADGAPDGSGGGEPWTAAVQAFPDEPPDPRARADALAVDMGEGLRLTHAQLLARSRGLASTGPIGVAADSPPQIWIPAVVRPLVSGEATVIIDGVGRDAAAAEGVARWITADPDASGVEE